MVRAAGTRRLVSLLALMIVGAMLASTMPVAAAPTGALAMRPELAAQLAEASDLDPLVVLVTGETTARAVEAVDAAGLAVVEVFDRLAVVAAAGSPRAIRDLHEHAGITRVDANLEVEWQDDVAHRATGVAQLRDIAGQPQLRPERHGPKRPFDGTGVSIAVIDHGFNTTHEQFVDENGESKFDIHLRQACPLGHDIIHYYAGTDPTPDCSAWVPVPEDESPASLHGTSVAGVAAGYARTAPSGAGVSGTAPGARLVGLSIGSGTNTYNLFSGLSWVLENHADPCGDGSCPPIRVVNNSSAASSDDDLASRGFDPDAPMSLVVTKLVEAGLVVVWAAGNSGGDGTRNKTNYFGLHPLPGVISVGAFEDGNAGNRDAGMWASSSRGRRGDPPTYPDLAAPGHNYLVACAAFAEVCAGAIQDGPLYSFDSGTSYAAPYVSGVVAQLLEAVPSLTPGEVEEILEDSAYQGFIDDELLEPDVYTDREGTQRGNANHETSFHAGHGLVDAVGALSLALKGKTREAPGLCPRDEVVTVTDPAGDTTITHGAAAERPGHDIVGVSTSMTAHPGALTVVVSFDDLAETEPRLFLGMDVFVDGKLAYADLDRTPAGDDFIFTGDVTGEGVVDPENDTVTFVIEPLAGPVRESASVWAWTSTGSATAQNDHAPGLCQTYAAGGRGAA